jgi:hypothetical protein
MHGELSSEKLSMEELVPFRNCFFMLIRLANIMMDTVHLEVIALCPLRHVPSHRNHGSLSYYQTGGFIWAGINDIDRYQEKHTVSLYSSFLLPHLSCFKLEVTTSEELPIKEF